MSQTSIAELYTFAVKGLTGAKHDQIALTAADCLPYDRAWAIEAGSRKFDLTNPSYFPKANFLMLMRDEKLAALDTTFDEESKVLTVFRGGKQVARGCLQDKLGRQLLEQFFAAYAKESLRGGAPKIVSAENHSFSDVPNKWVSIINLASVKDLERVARKPVHPLRFRGNIYLEGLDPWEEFNWLDRTLTIGGAPVLEVTERIKRCAAVNVDPETGARDLSLPRTLDVGFGHQDCGIYARVAADGQIAVGDKVVVTD
ncbi:MAG: MOSC domain-containing protein [Alphaproteobacteria bacterium]|nr:MOSC domain-containing protein [Alphaproteobacteria bacterium]